MLESIWENEEAPQRGERAELGWWTGLPNDLWGMRMVKWYRSGRADIRVDRSGAAGRVTVRPTQTAPEGPPGDLKTNSVRGRESGQLVKPNPPFLPSSTSNVPTTPCLAWTWGGWSFEQNINSCLSSSWQARLPQHREPFLYRRREQAVALRGALFGPS